MVASACYSLSSSKILPLAASLNLSRPLRSGRCLRFLRGFNPGARQAGENAFIALCYPLDLIGQVLEGESKSLNLPKG